MSRMNFKARAGAMLDRRLLHLRQHIDGRIDQVDSRIDELKAEIAAEHANRAETESRLQETLNELASYVRGDMSGVLRAIASEEPRNRRALYALREEPSYELPFSTPNPLVSICITTIPERREMMVERALASALSQTFENIEVVVVGNMAGEAVRESIASVGDPRVRFVDLTHRVVHPDSEREWLKAATMSRNEARRIANGLWITDLDDDDALPANAVGDLVDFVQQSRVELAYGYRDQHHPDGTVTRLSSFPPRPTNNDWSERGLPWQPWEGTPSAGALRHRGLNIFGREHVAAELHTPGDYFELERMTRAGVRFGMLDKVTYEYWPSQLWPGATEGETPKPV